MKKFLILLFIISPFLGITQTFENAIGVRGGLTAGIEYRYYTDDANAYKFLLGTRSVITSYSIHYTKLYE